MIWAVALQQLRSLRRQTVVVAILSLFLLMAMLTALLGWSSRHTVDGVYQVATELLTARGAPVPPSPVGLMPTLGMFANLEVYVPLIGALAAITLGHLAVVDDVAGGIGRLVFSRPISPDQWLLGRLTACGLVLSATTIASIFVTTVSLWFISGVPSSGAILRLIAFHGLSLVYLMFFASIGALAMVLARRRAIGLVSALGAWMGVTFTLPQLASGLRPTSAFSPVAEPISGADRFFSVTSILRPLSITEQYKQGSAELLQLPQRAAGGSLVSPVIINLIALAVVAAAAMLATRRLDMTVGAAND